MDQQKEAIKAFAIKAFRELVAHRMRMDLKDVCHRDIIITPYEGAYGWAGVVITVNGSPPRGTFLVRKSGPMVFVGNTGTRTLTSDYADRHRPVTTVRGLLISHGFPIEDMTHTTTPLPVVIRGEERR